MSIVFSAITPHTPILIPKIGKENINKINKTIDSFKKLEEDLYVSQPDTIIIISPHGVIQTNVFTMNLNPDFEGKFEEFGDFSTKIKLNCDIGLAYRVRERMETRAPLQLISEANLDYGASVPLFMLTEHIPQIKIIPIFYSGLDLMAHFEFGKLLNREILYNKNRIAIIASGELSHKLTKSAPAGYSPKGKKFDNKLIQLLIDNKVEEILNIDKKLIVESGECGLKSFIILLGILNGINYKPQMLSYEFPFGVGYLAMKFNLN